MKKIIKIDNLTLLELLERHYYDFKSKEIIVEYILINYPELDSILWIEYKENYEKSFVNYEIAKEKFTEYLKNFLNKDNFDWEIINFSEGIIEVKEK